jgi:acyl-ACP thioesterase
MEESTGDNDIRHAIKEPAERLVTPAKMMFARKRSVSFSDVDINRHTNNAKYIEWALDCINLDLVTRMKVTNLIINFNTESRLGDEISFCCAYSGLETPDCDNKSVFIEGKRGETSIFQVFLEYTF